MMSFSLCVYSSVWLEHSTFNRGVVSSNLIRHTNRIGGNTYIVTQAGLSTIPENITTVATAQTIKGVGNYNDFEVVAESFVENTAQNCYQIHGHRNTKHLPVQVNERVFNLEGQVEFGGCLRCVQALPNGTHRVFEIQNTVFKEPEPTRY